MRRPSFTSQSTVANGIPAVVGSPGASTVGPLGRALSSSQPASLPPSAASSLTSPCVVPWHPHGGSLTLPVSTGNHSCTLPVSRLSSSPPRRGTSPLREHQCLVTPVATPRVLDGIGACGSLGTPRGRSLNAPQQDMATLKAVRGEVELGLTPLRQELHELCDSMVTRMEAVEAWLRVWISRLLFESMHWKNDLRSMARLRRLAEAPQLDTVVPIAFVLSPLATKFGPQTVLHQDQRTTLVANLAKREGAYPSLRTERPLGEPPHLTNVKGPAVSLRPYVSLNAKFRACRRESLRLYRVCFGQST
eukprot:CAMPEP_0194545110 /NCGR_PEP_ID=MMETSP0253-20130528/88628_1 /TAXON_ID=2966 /ORGANISM="Noctiluca scintillans" /LENGTH=304 /DNA_ID=CAMNT_0039392077 /DNA_START=93 /DNA_END=1004 /DNA_ORIENTATION=+